jgi:hypothetical protein
MARLNTAIIFPALIGAALLSAAPASALCPAHESLYGTIQRVNGNEVIVQPTTGHWGAIDIRSAKMNANGNQLKPGTYLGAYGCVDKNGMFKADEVTLAANAAAYPRTQYGGSNGTPERSVTLSGTIQKIESNAIVVWEPGARHSGTWIVKNPTQFHVGQRVTGTGTEDHRGNFYPYQVSPG